VPKGRGEVHAHIAQVRRDVPNLVNRVAFAQERIVLTWCGNPEAALESMADSVRLQHEPYLGA